MCTLRQVMQVEGQVSFAALAACTSACQVRTTTSMHMLLPLVARCSGPHYYENPLQKMARLCMCSVTCPVPQTVSPAAARVASRPQSCPQEAQRAPHPRQAASFGAAPALGRRAAGCLVKGDLVKVVEGVQPARRCALLGGRGRATRCVRHNPTAGPLGCPRLQRRICTPHVERMTESGTGQPSQARV